MAPTLTEDDIDELVYLARTDDVEELAQELARHTGAGASPVEVLAAAVDEGGNTPLHMAAGNGHARTIAYLVGLVGEPTDASRAWIDATNKSGNTALHWAALNGHVEVVKALVEGAGASPLAMNAEEKMPLDLALLNSKQAVVDYLMEKAEAGSAEAEAKAKAAAEAGGKDGELSVATEGLSIEEA